ncbi:hypothetical protein DEA98_11660 [Brucella pseudogrignonensis]|nr:hypothetical protein [Brucella pseudogrignonensis]
MRVKRKARHLSACKYANENPARNQRFACVHAPVIDCSNHGSAMQGVLEHFIMVTSIAPITAKAKQATN